MSPNPFAGLIRSRKFLLAVIAGITAILGLWVGRLVDPETAQLIMQTWAVFAGILGVVIAMIAIEDRANVAADAKVAEAEIYKETTIAQIKADKATGASEVAATTTDEHLAELTAEFEAGAKAAADAQPD
jgi:proteasome assembly chaperone (PAC2) family protein